MRTTELYLPTDICIYIIYTHVKRERKRDRKRERWGNISSFYIIIINHYIVDTQTKSLHETVVIHKAKYSKFSRNQQHVHVSTYFVTSKEMHCSTVKVIRSLPHTHTHTQQKLLQITTLLVHKTKSLHC